MFVCLCALVSQKPRVETHEIFCAYCLWLWLGLSMRTMQYVIYFQFCALRHVFTYWLHIDVAAMYIGLYSKWLTEGNTDSKIWCLRLPCLVSYRGVFYSTPVSSGIAHQVHIHTCIGVSFISPWAKSGFRFSLVSSPVRILLTPYFHIM